MAINASISVSWVALYTGLHNVYYKLSTDSVYNLAGTSNCSVNNPCSLNFLISVENESCDTLTYDVYVQPQCFLIDGVSPPEGRVEEQIQFIPSPACKKYTYTCESVGIDTVDVNVGGDYNTPGLGPISVNAVSGGAVFDVTFDNTVNGAITLITVTTPGSYTSGDLPPVLDWVTAGITENVAADLTFNLLNCAALEQSGCSGVNQTIDAGLALDESVELCSTGVPPIPPTGYATPVENGNCLCECTTYTVEETDGGGDDLIINYIDCNNEAQEVTVVSGGTSGAICMVTDSLVVTPIGGAVANIIVGATCTAP
jgi:hypothetical protein